jgi:tetratricopeptide (TPR) repeat protein
VASSVRLFAPGYDLETFVPQIVLPSDGSKVPCQVLGAAQGDPMEVFFDSSTRNPSYLVYLVPKSKHQDPGETWQAQAGLVLETRWTTQRLRSSDRLPEFRDTFQNRADSVGRSLVDDIQQTFSIHWPSHSTQAPAARGGYGLYHYRGFFLASQEGKYHFATVSNWDSYLTIDDTLVVAWPGRHDMRGGTRAQKKGTVTLTPGVHKLEYFNVSPWGKMYALAAWKKPNESFRPMTRTDFISVGRYAQAAVQVRNEKGSYTPFAWSIVDDFRAEQTGRCFVTMHFKPLAPENTEETYRWTFDDGTVTTGHTVDHVFLRPGLRRAQLEVLADNKVISRVTQHVHVHRLWDRMLTNLDNADVYDQTLQQQHLDSVPVNDTVNVYRLAEKANKPDWKNRAAKTFKQNLSRLVQDADDTDFLFYFGHALHTVQHKDYQRAVTLFDRLTQKTGLDKQVQRQAAICQAEILITYQGKAQEALDLINQWQGRDSHDAWTRRAITAKAEVLLALGKSQEASELADGLSALDSGGGVKQKIKQAGLLRHARSLVTSSSDPNQWEYARAMIEQIVADDPSQIFAPHVNLVRIDLYLATGEYQGAYFLTERLTHLQLDDYHRAEILMRKVKACCGLRDLEKARAVYTDLKRDYPFHAVLAQAKQAIIEAFRK